MYFIWLFQKAKYVVMAYEPPYSTGTMQNKKEKEKFSRGKTQWSLKSEVKLIGGI